MVHLKEIQSNNGFYAYRFQPIQSSFGASMKTILADMQAFISSNRNIIYWIALVFLVDHFFLRGTFRDRLNKLIESILNKVEAQIKA
jgi:hypothetical protein